jgi:lincosamide and streptogramin A transport system ATP-binding/permease protein
MLAVLFSRENQFLLIDEPTNHLDMPTRDVVKDYLNSKQGFILVSHDRDFLDSCIDHVLVINKENITVEQGNFSSWWENKKRQDEFELAENEKLKKEIRRLNQSAKAAGNWADKVEATKIGRDPNTEKSIDTRCYIGEKSRRMQQRRKNLERRQEHAIEEKSKLLKNIETVDNLKIIPLNHHKDILVTAKDLAIYYDDKKITRDMDFSIGNGDRVILQGRNGCGKSSIIKKILGENIKTTGTLEIASGLKISYVSQDTSHLKGTLDDFIYNNALDETLFKALLRKLDFERVQFEKPMENYSGGQKKKVLIATSLCEQAHLYIWDEPLNFIDIFSRMQIERLINEFQPTMLLVEHDRIFTENIGTKFVEF